MFWRLMDPQHPEYDAALAAQNGSAMRSFYQQIDQVLGEVLQRMDDHTTLLVLSDHGFAPYNRSFNLNTWLLNNGYIRLKSAPARIERVLRQRGLEPDARLWAGVERPLREYART